MNKSGEEKELKKGVKGHAVAQQVELSSATLAFHCGNATSSSNVPEKTGENGLSTQHAVPIREIWLGLQNFYTGEVIEAI